MLATKAAALRARRFCWASARTTVVSRPSREGDNVPQFVIPTVSDFNGLASGAQGACRTFRWKATQGSGPRVSQCGASEPGHGQDVAVVMAGVFSHSPVFAQGLSSGEETAEERCACLGATDKGDRHLKTGSLVELVYRIRHLISSDPAEFQAGVAEQGYEAFDPEH